MFVVLKVATFDDKKVNVKDNKSFFKMSNISIFREKIYELKQKLQQI
jgi:hypothetical protein